MTMGNRIAEARKKKGYTQEYVALILGISRQAVYKWEKDQSRPDTTNLIALAELLDVTVDDLISATPKKRVDHAKLLRCFSSYSFFISLALYITGIFTGVLDEMAQIPARSFRMGIPWLFYGDSLAAIFLLFVVILLFAASIFLAVVANSLSKK